MSRCSHLGRAASVALVTAAMAVAHAQAPKFTPPRLLGAELPPLPAPTVAGGGEVLIEATVDRTGALIRPIVVRSTPPYTQMMLDAMRSWRFEPARATGQDGREAAVDMPVAIAAVWRPPTLLNTPTIGEPPKDFSRPSADVAFPVAIEAANYPPQARDGGVVLLEVALDAEGQVHDARGVASIGGFESVARDALARWRFTPAAYRARAVPATAYVLFGFRPPVITSPPPPR